jgi:ribosomal protein S18 acetylase RimI-like enzyme
MQIVTAGLQHLDPLAELFDAYRQFYRQPAARKRARDYLAARISQHESVVFLALDEGGTALGFTQLYPTFCSVATAGIWVLYDLFVANSARRRGVGRALMERATEHALSTGAVRIDLSTALDNAPAQALYENLGYQKDSEFFVYSLDLESQRDPRNLRRTPPNTSTP